MAVTITLDDHVAKSVERAIDAALHAADASPDPRHPEFGEHLAVALDVLCPAIVEAEGRWLLANLPAEVPAFDPHAPNAHDALDDGWGNDGE